MTSHKESTAQRLAQLQGQVDHLQQKLSCKTDTILRLGKELERMEKEKHAISARTSTLERNLERAERNAASLTEENRSLMSNSKEDKNTLISEIERLKNKLSIYESENRELEAEKMDLRKDCKTFRQKIAKHDVDKLNEDESELVRGSRQNSSDESLLQHEKLYSRYKQMESDLHTVLGVKEELVKERENLLKKVERLSNELTYLLNGDSKRVIEDLDTVLAENRFLKAQLSTAHEESESIKSTLAKYRAMAESKSQKPSQNGHGEENMVQPTNSVAVVNMKQIRELLTSQAIDLDDSDLRAITTILLDVVNDKQMALTHQRRANKVLGNRLHELEGHLAVLGTRSSRSCSPRVEEQPS